MFCINCGSQVDDDAKFCEKCGAPVTKQNAQSTPQTESPMMVNAGQVTQQAPVNAAPINAPRNVPVNAAPINVPVNAAPVNKSAGYYTPPVSPDAENNKNSNNNKNSDNNKKGKKSWVKFVVIGAVALVVAAAAVFLFALGGLNTIRSEIILKQAEKLYSDGDYDEAVEKYLAIIDINDKNADAYIGLAKAYMELGDYESAADILEDGLDELPDNDDLADLLKKVEKQLAKEEEDDDSDDDSSDPDAGSHEVSGGATAGVIVIDEPAEVADTRYSNDGKVLNIYVWNTEWITRLTDYYPDYIPNDYSDVTAGGWIGDVEVRFNVTSTTNNDYQDNLDYYLENNEYADADDKVDIFLVEADYALKYVDTDYTLSMSEIGLSDSVFADQYQYTKDVVTDSYGELKGSSWQCCPGALIYRADIAEAVLGSSDPAVVQEYVKDWDTFKATADLMSVYGYQMTATVLDTYRVFSNNVTSKWVEDDTINVDPNIEAWVEMSKEMVDAGQTSANNLWSDAWSAGFYEYGNVFCYFGPAWLIDFSMHSSEYGSVGYNGGWRVTEGPQGFYWGGTWICAATGTDNADLVADIIKTMTTDDTVLSQIIENDSDFVNDSALIEQYANDSWFGDSVLGWQNPLGIFSSGVSSVDLSNISTYDQGCNECFQSAMMDYFEGYYSTYEEALEAFYSNIQYYYPELRIPQ